MDCRRFRENHFAFVDDILPGIELVGMQVHLSECESCAKHDATVRRSLMLFRSLPSIEPSPDFSSRLEQKLKGIRADAGATHSGRARRFAAAVVISSTVMLAYIGVQLREVDVSPNLAFPPVVALASINDSEASGVVNNAAGEMAAVAPAGLPIWTAVLLADQSSAHFASVEFASASR